MKIFTIILLVFGISVSVFSQSVSRAALSGNTTKIIIEKINTSVPGDYNIYPACPNVFGPNTKIKFDVPVRSDIKVNIYDFRGRFITNLISESFEAGVYSMNWLPADKDFGLYNFELVSGDVKIERKIVLAK